MRIILRDGTGEMQLNYLSEEMDRHGNVRVYYRRNGRRIRLRKTPGTDEFLEEYRAASTDAEAPKEQTNARGSFGWLLIEYYQSAEFKSLAKGKERRTRLDAMREKHGHKPYALLAAAQIRKLRDSKSNTPEAANAVIKDLRQVFDWAKEMGYAAHNPAKDVPYFKTETGGFHTWTIEEVVQYEVRHPIGTKARLALDLLLYSGVRRSDVVTFGRQMERGGFLHFIETKGRKKKRKERDVPIIRPLRTSIDAMPPGNLTYLVTEFGKPFTNNGFGNWFKKRCREAGLPHCSAHGLRKCGATLAADRGATAYQLMGLYGWETIKQTAVYTKKADRKRLAGEALRLLEEQKTDTTRTGNEQEAPLSRSR